MKYKKIYIIGPVGSGKTTLARKMSVKYNINYYELDKVIWDDDNGNIKRLEEERDKLFNKIINKKTWIIEDVGRNCFESAVEKADIVYYINLNKLTLYFRVTKRWIKQKLKLENYNYKPTIKDLIQMYIWINKDLNNKEEKITKLKIKSKKLIILSDKL